MGGKSSGTGVNLQPGQGYQFGSFIPPAGQTPVTNIGQQGPGLNQQNPGTTGASALNTGVAGLNQNFGTSGGKSSGIFDNKQYIAPGSNSPGFNVIDPTTANDPSGMAYDASTPQGLYQNYSNVMFGQPGQNQIFNDVMIQQPDGTFRSPQELANNPFLITPGLQKASPLQGTPAMGSMTAQPMSASPAPTSVYTPMPGQGGQPGSQDMYALDDWARQNNLYQLTDPGNNIARGFYDPTRNQYINLGGQVETDPGEKRRLMGYYNTMMRQTQQQQQFRAPTPQQLQARRPVQPPVRRPSVQPPMLPSRPQPRRR